MLKYTQHLFHERVLVKSRINEKGSIVHIVVVIVLVVALLGALGFIFWQNTRPSDSSEKSTNEANTTSQSTKNDDTETSSADLNEGYLVIDSWNVRFKPMGAAKVSYESKGNGYWVTTDKWKNFGGICDANGGVLLERSMEKSTILASPPRPLNNEEKIGDYYYYYSGPQSGCSDDHANEETVEYQIIKDLLSTIESKK